MSQDAEAGAIANSPFADSPTAAIIPLVFRRIV